MWYRDGSLLPFVRLDFQRTGPQKIRWYERSVKCNYARFYRFAQRIGFASKIIYDFITWNDPGHQIQRRSSKNIDHKELTPHPKKSRSSFCLNLTGPLNLIHHTTGVKKMTHLIFRRKFGCRFQGLSCLGSFLNGGISLGLSL